MEIEHAPLRQQHCYPSRYQKKVNEIVSAAAHSVLSHLGTNHSEAVYHKAMRVELDHELALPESHLMSTPYSHITSEVPVLIKYRNITVGQGRIDMILQCSYESDLGEYPVLVEFKVASNFSNTTAEAVDQLKRYMRDVDYSCPFGIVIVFPKRGAENLKIVTVEI